MEMVDRKAHVTTPIVSVTEPAQGPSLALRIPRLHGKVVRLTVMSKATIGIARSKVQGAEVVVDVGKLALSLISLGQRLRRVQCRDALIISPEKADAGRYPDPRSALSNIVHCRQCNLAKRLHRLVRATKLAQNSSAKQTKAHKIIRGSRKRTTSLRQLKSAFIPEEACLRLRRLGITGWRARVFRSVQMLGPQ
jgi:hypothetical protein